MMKGLVRFYLQAITLWPTRVEALERQMEGDHLMDLSEALTGGLETFLETFDVSSSGEKRG